MSTNIWDLPDDCLERILLLTSPEDIIQSSLVSKQFSSVALSDDLWRKLLPSDYDQIIDDASSPVESNSPKDIFFLLYHSHLLIDHDRKSISLDRQSMKKCYMLGSRSLTIIWGDSPEYWSWISVPESRFPENAKLESVCWLYIKGEIPTNSLSANTTYGVYFVFKMAETYYSGFERVPVKVSLSEVDESEYHPIVTNTACLNPQEEDEDEDEIQQRIGRCCPVDRGDGWMEIEMGTYQVGADENDGVCLEMVVSETEILNWKSDLLVQGFHIRPLHH